ncbi:MAG: hypothetical protein F6K62_26780 [Sphaerospermopsis sp. SIO1G2]|nr:hypothetical protein [Sphaerospermopsis sp. SIO1G1]NET74383.1 hypothetical protein [Sphaerospermopsis sp. SIO1G2]
MSKKLSEAMKIANDLAPDEQLTLISHLLQRISLCEITPQSKYNITELEGIAPNLLGGMDAQEYITKMRNGEFPDLEIQETKTRKPA